MEKTGLRGRLFLILRELSGRHSGYDGCFLLHLLIGQLHLQCEVKGCRSAAGWVSASVGLSRISCW
jgi:hypothetical protein